MKQKKSTTDNTESTDKKKTAMQDHWAKDLHFKLDELTKCKGSEWHVLRALKEACIMRQDFCSASRLRELMAKESVPALPPIIVKALVGELARLRKKMPSYERSLGEWLLLIDLCLKDAQNMWAMSQDDSVAYIRRVAALCIRALENTGSSALEDL